MDAKTELTAESRDILQQVLRAHLPTECEVWVFGSHAKQTAHRYSDLDLALKWHKMLPPKTLFELKEALNESRLAFAVDVVDLHQMETSFRAIVESTMIPFIAE